MGLLGLVVSGLGAISVGRQLQGYIKLRGFLKLWVPFWGSPKNGLPYFGVYVGAPLCWETTISAFSRTSQAFFS